MIVLKCVLSAPMSSVIVVDKPVISQKIVKSISPPKEIKASWEMQTTLTKNIKISWPKLAAEEAVESGTANLQHVSRINHGNNLNKLSLLSHHGYFPSSKQLTYRNNLLHGHNPKLHSNLRILLLHRDIRHRHHLD